MTPFSMTLRRLRRQRGVTQRELAQRLGVDPSYLSGLERGCRPPPRRHAFLANVQSALALSAVEFEEIRHSAEVALALGKMAYATSPEHVALALAFYDKLKDLQPYQLRVIAAALETDPAPCGGHSWKGGCMAST